MDERDVKLPESLEGQASENLSKRKMPVLPYIFLAIFVLTLVPGPLFFVGLMLPGPLKAPVTIVVPRGASVKEIARLLDEKDLLVHPLLFRAAASLMANNKLQAGEYHFVPELSSLDLARILRDGKTVLRQLTIPEGLTSHEIVEMLRVNDALSGEIVAVPEEGALMPESYRYSLGDARTDILSRMQKEQDALLAELWDKRSEGLPFKTPREALILASIVEKETGYKAEERARVAGVFINRLARGMPLQSDPTVIYAHTNGKGAFGRPLVRKDLKKTSPFNTYENAGLPPAPICNPGRAAIEAVLIPQRTDELYFVADGSGGHAFAKTLSEHNENVAKWMKLKKP